MAEAIPELWITSVLGYSSLMNKSRTFEPGATVGISNCPEISKLQLLNGKFRNPEWASGLVGMSVRAYRAGTCVIT